METSIFTGFRFAEENTESGWRRTGRISAWALDPCQDGGYPSDPDRADWLAARRDVGPGTEDMQLALYPTLHAAERAFKEMRAELHRCADLSAVTGEFTGGGGVTMWDAVETPLGSQSLHADGFTRVRDGSPDSVAAMVMRQGNAILLRYDWLPHRAVGSARADALATTYASAEQNLTRICPMAGGCWNLSQPFH